MKRKGIFAGSLLLVYMAMQAYSWMPYIHFKLNQDHIAQNLCEQREVANATCQGSCQLKLMLEEAESSPTKHAVPLLQPIEQIPHTEVSCIKMHDLLADVCTATWTNYDCQLRSQYKGEIPQPPPQA